MTKPLLTALFPLALFLASCSPSTAGDSLTQAAPDVSDAFAVTEIATFDEPWAIALIPGSPYALITEKAGKLKLWQADGPVQDVAGVLPVAYGGQGGLGDVVIAPDYATSGMIYLSWAEDGQGNVRGAVVARARLVLDGPPRLEGLQVIWRQSPKTSGQGHYSHRIAFSPDGQYLFIASGERQKFTPAQDMGGNLGKIVRLLPDGTPAPGNPFESQGGIAAQVWSLGHRNILGLAFDSEGRLWDVEHGPAGGDELNLVKPGQNYGWPLVSQGNHYDGRAIPRHPTRPDLAAPAVWWNPVIGPGGMVIYSGKLWPEWKGQALIAGLVSGGIVRVRIEGEKATEQARHPLDARIRAIAEAEDGSLLVLEDGPSARLLRLSRRNR
jgi:glucose/arabinose dehydrogenase